MDLQQLYSMGAFVSAKPIKRALSVKWPETIPFEEWADPNAPEFTGRIVDATVDVWLKRPSSADDIAMAMVEPERQVYVGAFRLVKKEDGTPAFDSIEAAESMASWLLVPLWEAIKEVAARSPKVNSGTTTPSGSKSPDSSEAAPRKSGKKLSAPSGETS